MRKKIWIGAAAAVGLLAACQPGTLDTGWSGDGGAEVSSWRYDNHQVAGFPDGSAVVSRAPSGTTTSVLTKLLPSGAVDTSWGTGGDLLEDFSWASAGTGPSSITALDDGGLLVGGSFDRYTSGLLRVTPAGQVDTTYGTGGRIEYDAYFAGDSLGAHWVDGDGTAIETSDASPTGITLRHYSASGSVSTSSVPVTFTRSFPTGTYDRQVHTWPTAIAPHGDGWLVSVQVGGSYMVPDPGGDYWGSLQEDAALVRITAGGTVDPAFNGGQPLYLDPGTSGGTTTNTAGTRGGRLQLRALPGGGAVGLITTSTPDTWIDRCFLVRLTAAGALDTTFDGDGILHVTFGGEEADCADLEVLGTAGAVTVGLTTAAGGSQRGVVTRYTSTGAVDTTFGPYGQGYLELPGTLGVSALGNAGGKVLASAFDPSDADPMFGDEVVYRIFG